MNRLKNIIFSPLRYKILSSFFVFLFLFSCSEDPAPVKIDTDDTNETLLAGTISKVWQITSSKKDGIEWLPDCVKDDDWKFNRDGTFARTSQTVSCTNGFPDTDFTNWYFENDEEWLTFAGGTYEITLLTENKMILTFYGESVTYTDTFTKK